MAQGGRTWSKRSDAGATRLHVERIMRHVAGAAVHHGPGALQAGLGPASVVEESWRRCVLNYGLDPLCLGPVEVLEEAQIRHRAEAVEELLPLAQGLISNLGAGLKDEAHAILLANRESIILHRLGDLGLGQKRKPAPIELEPGAVWDERRQGTNGIGTSITTGDTSSIFLADHFSPGNSWLSCTSTPLRSPSGQVVGALNVTLLGGPGVSRRSAVEHLLETAARRIEDMLLLSQCRGYWIIGLTSCAELAGLSCEGLVAIDDSSRIAGANAAFRKLLPAADRASPIGRSLEQVLGVSLEGLLQKRSAVTGATALTIGRSTVYATARAPAQRPRGKLRATTEGLRTGPSGRGDDLSLEEVGGSDPKLRAEVARIRRLIDRKIPIIIGGETGTGKEVLARAIHQASSRASKSFVAINCASIPETLIESELFGYADGAFTGANKRGFRGKVIQSSGGTLFLDEIGDMTLEAQTRLLRVIAEQEVCPLGSDRVVPVDLNIICASHQSLDDLADKGRFRPDLLYRLDGAKIVMPALRDRADKIELILSVLDRETAEFGIEAKLEESASFLLASYHWPGNIRQLRHVMRAAILASTTGRIACSELPPALTGADTNALEQGRLARATLDGALGNSGDAQALSNLLREEGWCVAQAARILGVSRQALYRRMNRLGIVSPNRADVGGLPR